MLISRVLLPALRWVTHESPRSRALRRAGAAVLAAFVLALLAVPAPGAQGGDTTPPVLTGRSPAPGATGVSMLINVQAVFSEPIQAATLSLILRDASSQIVPADVSYDADTRTATLDPQADLVGGQQFTITASNARDLAGNQMAQAVWSFTTAVSQFTDVELPQLGLTDPTVIQFASDGRVFVAEKSGRIWVYDSLSDTTATLVADLRVSVYNFWDRGMLGMALHPNFPVTPYLYALYTYDAVPGGAAPRWGTSPYTNEGCAAPTGAGCVVTGRLVRLNVGNPGTWPLDHGDEEPLVTDWPQQFPSHSTGALVFDADGALYASGGDGASFNYVDYGQTASTPPINDPLNQGGALRSQDLRTSGDPVTLDGSIIRIDPDTGLALPDNPRFSSDPDANGKRIVAHGFRNPFRITIRPGTREVWVGDVGWSTWEEVNRVIDPIDATVDNFGWPCYEGSPRQSGYDGGNFPICETLYGDPSAVVSPYFAYRHADSLLTCGAGSSSISGLAFYSASGGTYPGSYNGALFFADYSRSCIWAMRAGADGLPNPSDIVQIQKNTAGPVNLIAGPGGDIYYPGYNDDRLHRLSHAGNLPPNAVIQANPTTGPTPLDVSFSGTGSSDPEGQTLTYAWDLDGDGAFDDSSAPAPQWTYTTGGVVTVRLVVTDTAGLADVEAVTILANNTGPTAFIDTPAASTTWQVGNTIAFSGHATDPDQPGNLPPSALSWEVIIHHCPSNCHTHTMQTFAGVASGSFAAPDHEYPAHLELRLTATDQTGLQHTTSIDLQPRTVVLTFQTNPAGLQLGVNAATQTTPFNRTVIVGSSNSLTAPSPQQIGPQTYQFSAWSDGLAASHNITAPASLTTYTATYTQIVTTAGLVAAYGFNDGSGTAAADWTGSGHTGAISGAAWNTAGRFGGALQFDGVNDLVTVADAPDLDLTTGMTVEAWVNPTALSSWRTVALKEMPNGLAYALYANVDGPRWGSYINTGTYDLHAESSSAVPLNAWSHLAMTYDGTTIRIYRDGAEVAIRVAGGAIRTTAQPLQIGGNNVWSEWFAGRIDEVRVYNRALTSSEIASDMNTPIGGAPLPDTTPPTATVTAPANNAFVGGTVTVAANASDNVGVASVQFLLDGQPLGAADTTAPYSVSWNTTLATNGPHALSARATDAQGNEGTSAAVNVTVDNVPPTVAVSSPAPGASVSGTISVEATASDSSSGVASVQFRLDGSDLGSPDTTSPYSVSWNTTQASNGSHALTAVATDGAGRQATSAAVTVTVSNSWTVPSGLVAAYTFSEGTGGTTADASGGGGTGTLSGATWTTSGKFGGALSFDGVNDWVTVADAAALDLTSGMTMEAWVYPTALGSWRTVALKEVPGGLAYSLYADDNPPRPSGYVNLGAADRAVGGTGPLPLNTWSHLAVTYGGGSLRLFVNGAQVATVALTGSIQTSGSPLRIGGNSVWGEYFAGRIDEVRIYNRALTPAEILAGMNRSLSGP